MIRNAFLHDSGLPRILYLLGIGVMVMCAYQLEPFQFFMLWDTSALDGRFGANGSHGWK